MKNLSLLGAAVLPVLALSLNVEADTQRHYSGNACQPSLTADYTYAATTGGGITNNNGLSGLQPSVNVVCPVTGMQSTTQTQTDLMARLFVGSNGSDFGTFWQVNNQNLSTTWYSSVKYACSTTNGCTAGGGGFTGNATVRWTGAELYGSSFTSFSAYSMRSAIPPKCVNEGGCGTNYYIQAYWVTNTQS